MESLDKYIMGNIGVKGVPLSRVVISKEAVYPILDGPEISFSSAKDEMVARHQLLNVV